jgi:hypothetical protein
MENFEKRKNISTPNPKVNISAFFRQSSMNAFGFFSMPALSRSSFSDGKAFSNLGIIFLKILAPLLQWLILIYKFH